MATTDDQYLPVPPPFMFACGECTDLLRRFAEKVSADVGCFYEQLAVAKHIVEEHPDALPGPHGESCSLCSHFAKRGDADLWEEHRARDLFLPEAVARLL